MKTVLIIDDEEKIRDIYVRVFQALGSRVCRVLQAPDAVAATNTLIREKIDLVLLDIMMPTIDGRIMFDVIKEYGPEIDVVIASVFPVERQRVLFPYAKDYFDKSEGPFVLLDKLTSILE
jgi:CheY-like chemotaxis protein